MPVPGPRALGRGVVVNAGDPVPAPWAGAPELVIDDAALADPGAVVRALHVAWADREPVVVRLGVDPGEFRAPASYDGEPWALGPRFEPWSDRLHFLVWANTYDARGGTDPIWWWGRKAARLGATATPEGEADVVLPNGTAAWVDGGPRAPWAVAELDAPVVAAETVEAGRLDRQPAPVAPSAQLAPDQLAAVAHRSGAARVIAPAGSGKTRVLTERLRHLIVDRGYEREGVLAVAYNKKAQEEMEERCVAFRPRVRTLNALGFALLGEAAGRSPRVLEEREVRRIVEELVPKPRWRANTDPIGPYLEALSLVRLGLRDPQDVEDGRDDVPGLAEAFDPFRQRLASAGAVDFDEQVYGAVELLLRDGEFRRRAQTRCRHLLVDELQDLTPAHVLLLRLLAAPELDVFGVGDDDQVIYGHAGADPGFLLDFAELFPGAADHRLEVNYRCPVPVVDAARTLLSYNRRRVPKQITAGPGAEAAPDALQVVRHAGEAGATALTEIARRWLAEPDGAAAQVAVLARVTSLLLAPHIALVEAGIPVDSILRPDVLERTGVRAALAYLRIAADPSAIDGADVIEVYRRPSRGLPQWFPKWLRGRFTLDTLHSMSERIDDAKVGAKVEDLVDDLRLVIDAARRGSTRHVLSVIKDGIGLGAAMSLLDGSASGDGGSSHLDDLEALEQVADLHPDPSSFEPWLRASLHREAAPGGVTLSTIHRVKGREWDRVLVFGATAGLLPHRLADDVEEERRVLHVAVTRGRHRVAVLGDASRPSPFLDELAGTAPHAPARSPGTVGRPVPGSTAGSAATGAAAGGARSGRAERQRRAAAAVAGMSVEEQRRHEALRAWRTERARRDKVAPFIVLYDRHVEGIARANPANLRELRALEGIGPTKLELYGEEILAVLAEADGSSAD